MRSLVAVAAALACASCVGSLPRPQQRTVSVEHESDWIPVAEDPMIEEIRRLADRASGPRTPGGAPRGSWGLGPDLTTGSAGGVGASLLATGEVRRAPAPPGSSLPDLPLGRSQEYTVGPEDVLDVAVSARPEFSAKVTVRADGKIVLPAAGDLIDVAGRTAAEAAELVAAAVHPAYLRQRPGVSVEIVASPRWVYYVFGAVAREGRFELRPGRVKLLDALIASSGESGPYVRKPGAWTMVRVITPREDGPAVAVVDVEALMRGARGENVVIRPGQIVYVPRGEGVTDETLIARALGRPRPADDADGPSPGRE